MPHLLPLKESDEGRADQHREKDACDARSKGPKGDVLEDIKKAVANVQWIEQVEEHDEMLQIVEKQCQVTSSESIASRATSLSSK